MDYRKNYKVERNYEGLMDHCCNMMEFLANRTVSLDETKQQEGLIKQANNLIRTELDTKKFENKVEMQARANK